MMYTAPEGYTFDPASGKYYKSEVLSDPASGRSVKWVTWFDPNTGAYEQQSYPVVMPAQVQPQTVQPKPQKKSMPKAAIVAITAGVCFVIAGALMYYFLGWSPGAAPNDDNTGHIAEPTAVPIETPEPTAPAPSPSPAPTPTPEPTPDDPAPEIYRELYGRLYEALERLGYGYSVPQESGALVYHGVFYADLVDFDNDGIFELLYLTGNDSNVYLFTCDMYGRSGDTDTHRSDTIYINHGTSSIATDRDGRSYYVQRYWEMGESGASYYTIVDGKWTQVLQLLKTGIELDDLDYYVNGTLVDEAAYDSATESLYIINNVEIFNLGAYVEGEVDAEQIYATLKKFETLCPPGTVAEWDEITPIQLQTADGNTFTVPITDWPLLEDYTHGGRIEINKPVGGIIRNGKNFHRFTLSDMEVSNDFGLTLVIEASTDEPFEINLHQSDSSGNSYGEWFNSVDANQYVTHSGRVTTIKIPARHYWIDTYTWLINCPEYQWSAFGPDGPYSDSDLKLKFAFLLEPGERPYFP